MSVYCLCPQCGIGGDKDKDTIRRPSFEGQGTTLRITCRHCEYTGSVQYNHPGPERWRKKSSTSKLVAPFFSNLKLSKEADQLAQSSNGLREPLGFGRRARKLVVPAASEQTSITSPVSPSISHSPRRPTLPEQVHSVEISDEWQESPDMRSFKERVWSLSPEEQRRLGYKASGSDISERLRNDELAGQTNEITQTLKTLSRGSSPLTTLHDVGLVRERTFRTKPIHDARLSAQNLCELERSHSSDETTMVTQAVDLQSTSTHFPSVSPADVERVRSRKCEIPPTSEDEPFYPLHHSNHKLNTRKSASTKYKASGSSTKIAGLRAASIAEPLSAAAQIQVLEPSAAIKHVHSRKSSTDYSFVPDTSTATAQLQVVPPSKELMQVSTAPQAPCKAKNCPIATQHPEGVYNIQDRRFHPAYTTTVLPPEVVAAKTRVELLESGEEFKRYMADVSFLTAFEDVHVSEPISRRRVAHTRL